LYGIGGVVVVAYCLYVFVVAGPISADKVIEMRKKGHQEAPWSYHVYVVGVVVLDMCQ